MAASRLAPVFDEPRFIRNKVAQLVSGVAAREFPQRWPTFVTDMLQLADRGDAQAEVALMVRPYKHTQTRTHPFRDSCRLS